MTKVWRDGEIDLSPLDGQSIAIIGYGNQGRAQALNARDSGLDVTVGQRPGKSWDLAVADGFEPVPIAAAVSPAQFVVVTLPDETMGDTFASQIAPSLVEGSCLIFAHGFGLRFGTVVPPSNVDAVVVSPKGPGRRLREAYESGGGLAAFYAMHQDATGTAAAKALAYGAAIGCGRVGIVETTVAQETESDLFGEQVVLCGGIPELIQAAFETLVDAGFSPELAYIECVQEAKYIVDLVAERGLAGMRQAISGTAAYGGMVAGKRIIDSAARARMRQLLAEIQGGTFAEAWVSEARRGGAEFRALLAEAAESEIEDAGRSVRSLMSGEVQD